MFANELHHHPLRRFFAGLVEDALCTRIGVCDPGLADYLAGLLADFIHVDHLFPLTDAKGRRLQQVAEMLTDAISPPGTSESVHRRLVHKHVGDFILFWTGVYPENLRRLRSKHGVDQFVDYLSQGKQSYAIASELSRPDSPPPAALLRRLSDDFEACVYGLSLVRQGWEQLDPVGFAAGKAVWS